MVFSRALALLGIDTAAVLALGLWLQSQGPPFGGGMLWGLFAGVLTALSAIGGAWFAEVKGLKPNQALAIVVVGMLGRMAFLTVWALIAVHVGGTDALGFITGFGAVYLLGQILEVWMLTRLKSGQAG